MSITGIADKISIPMADGTYREYSLLQFMGVGYSQLQSASGMGMPPMRILEQRGPLQHGSTAVGYRYDQRTIQVVIAKQIFEQTRLANARWELVDMLRPSRNFPAEGGESKPLIYKRWLPGGMRVNGVDGVLTNGSAEFTSNTGRFKHFGLRPGSRIWLMPGASFVPYTIQSIDNDFTLELPGAWGATTVTGVPWYFMSEPCTRELFCYMVSGPQFDRGGVNPNGYIEALRFLGADPFWYGWEQTVELSQSDEIANLIFDYGEAGVTIASGGAQFGITPGTGRWAFSGGAVTQTTTVVYWGNEGAVPTLTVVGPCNNLQVSNAELETQIALNYYVKPGETVVIDSLNLTAISDTDGDVFQYLAGDLTGFLLSPDGANDRSNTLTVDFSGGSAATRITLTWRNRYGSS